MSNTMDLLGWLEEWYRQQCDGEWEHHAGVTIDTLDNPGWLVKADLRGLDPASIATDRVLTVTGEPPRAENGNLGGPVWMTCEIRAGKFIGAGDPSQLRTILAQFRSLIEAEAT